MLARLYKAHHDLHMEDLSFWEAVCRHNHGPVLELGCGTGRILLPLASQGRRLFGIDRDRKMLAVLQEQISRKDSQIHLIQADIRAFAFGMQFPTILLPCNTFSTLSARGRRATLQAIHRHLSPDGIFAVSTPNPSLLASLPSSAPLEYEETIRHPLDGQPVTINSGWHRTSTQLIFEWVYEHHRANGVPIRYEIQSAHFLTPTEAYLKTFKSCELKVLEIFGDFNDAPLEQDSPFLILIAGKN